MSTIDALVRRRASRIFFSFSSPRLMGMKKTPTLTVFYDAGKISKSMKVLGAVNGLLERFAHPTPPAKVTEESTTPEGFSFKNHLLLIFLVLEILFGILVGPHVLG